MFVALARPITLYNKSNFLPRTFHQAIYSFQVKEPQRQESVR
jgi:hypothetical protein